MSLLADRNGKVEKKDSFQDRFLAWMYGHWIGRFILKPFTFTWFSKTGGMILDSRFSKLLIGPFIKKNHINMEIFEKKIYKSYNDFFTRRMKPGKREIDEAQDSFISPCDGRLMVFPIDEIDTVKIKHTRYTIPELIRNQKLAEKYRNGWIWVFRLCVEDYHRYIYPDSGIKSQNRKIPGVFHTVNPVANDVYPIYKENTREYTILHSKHFGNILMMEVGALLVGRIQNFHEKAIVTKGQEKGYFCFGGSTIVVMTEKNRVIPDLDICNYSRNGIETRVYLGERVGKAMDGFQEQKQAVM